jgi:hypothetical protein
MSQGVSPPSKDPDIVASAKALRRAAKRALQVGIQTGTPVYVMKRGKIVDIAKEASRSARRGSGRKPKSKAG